MNKKIKIVVAGIGGVGGYFGGLLAKYYENSDDVEIHFLARGEHLKEIQKNGLTVIKGEDTFVAKPESADDNLNAVGIVDFILVCTKSYDLDSAVQQMRNNIGANTFILPLLNGVDSTEKIMTMLPGTTVASGCVYVVAYVKEAGVVENNGAVQKLFFGIDNTKDERLNHLANLMESAGIDSTLSEKIEAVIWEKFIFISPIATATSFFNNTIGELMADADKKEFITTLINEVIKIANAKHISMANDIREKTINKLLSMPYDAASSMHRDYQNKKPNTEVETLTGYVIREGQRLHIPTPAFEKAYKGLIERQLSLN